MPRFSSPKNTLLLTVLYISTTLQKLQRRHSFKSQLIPSHALVNALIWMFY